MEVGISYYGNKEEYMREEENCNITPFIHLSPRVAMTRMKRVWMQDVGRRRVWMGTELGGGKWGSS